VKAFEEIVANVGAFYSDTVEKCHWADKRISKPSHATDIQ
jgi:hypothetical protein